jgi:hypothetical protein
MASRLVSRRFATFCTFLSFDAHFLQRFARVPKKAVEMPVV